MRIGMDVGSMVGQMMLLVIGGDDGDGSYVVVGGCRLHTVCIVYRQVGR